MTAGEGLREEKSTARINSSKATRACPYPMGQMQRKTHNSYMYTLTNVNSGTERHIQAELRHAYPLHHMLLALWHLPPTQQRSVGGWIISLPWGRENEREEGGWEGGCSQPELMSFYGKHGALEQTKQHSTATSQHGRKHQNRAPLKITEQRGAGNCVAP